MATLQELRDKLLQQEKNQRSASSDNAIFPFWNMKEGLTATIRFLPDGDENNDFFWVERQMIRLPFEGIIGQTTQRTVFVQVPCMEMWGETCPVLTEIRPWFKEAGREDDARKYWKKRSYVFQGFIRDNPLQEDDGPENPIRRLVINPSIFDIIRQALMDPEMEEMPTDYTSGTDFRLSKTKQGEYPSYTTSNYSRKSTSLDATEAEVIEKYGLFNLSDYLPKKPSSVELEAITEMFNASKDGEFYDPQRWAKHYRPNGLEWNGSTSGNNEATVSKFSNTTSNDSTPPASESTNESTETSSSAENLTEAASDSGSGKKSPKDILAEIKQRASENRS